MNDVFDTSAGPMNSQRIADELLYANYVHNRKLYPDFTAEQWAKCYPNAAEMESRYQRESERYADEMIRRDKEVSQWERDLRTGAREPK